jgi:hypothetical protein
MFAASKTASVSGGYQISRSLRFNSADSAYLNRTPASTTNQKTWTYSGWIKRSTLANANFECIFGAGTTDETYITFRDTDVLQFRQVDSSTETISLITTQVFRDVSAWYHIVVAVDTTQATSTNRIKIYLNGTQITAFGTATYPSQNANTYMSSTVAQYIGKRPASSAYYPNGYMTEINFIDGQALTPSSFGETNAQTGVWQPKAYSGSYGTNGFYLNFSDNSNTTAATLGKDYSGNGNNWTPNNFSVTAGSGNDSMVDSPTSYGVDTGAGGEVRGNYGTLNPIGLGGGTLTNGNLDFSATATTTPAVGTFALTTGKWYWEVRCNSVSSPRIGVYDIGSANPTDLGGTAFGWCLLNSPSRTFTNGSTTSYGAFSPVIGTIVMVAYDADAGKLWFGQDGTWFASGVPSTGTSPSMSSVTGKAIVPAVGNGNVGTDTYSINLGQRAFSYTAPSGFKALCTQNLPTPTIGATSATTADKYFGVNTWTGTNATQTITNGGFYPDFLWIKSRSYAADNTNFDSVRGANKVINSNLSAAEYTPTANTGLSSFNSNGFTLYATDVSGAGSTNYSPRTYVGWQWNAGSGSTVSNTSGSITSTVSASTTSGFSVVTYTGNGANSTVGHGLGAVPQMIIVKCRTTAFSWRVYHASVGNVNSTLLNSNAAPSALSSWNSTTPTSTVFTLGTDVGTNQDGSTFVAYCFAPIAGYSTFGSYTGNGSADGPFVFTGFRPAFVVLRRTNSTGGWFEYNNKSSPSNVVDKYIELNAASTEGTYTTLDFLSNGFKLRQSDAEINGSGSTFIFMAFAENPFKYSLAR